MTDPTTDADWTIHALNIHGAFFERWCRRVIAKTPQVESQIRKQTRGLGTSRNAVSSSIAGAEVSASAITSRKASTMSAATDLA